MDRYIGLDVHSTSCSMAVLGPSGRKLSSQVIAQRGPGPRGRLERRAPAGAELSASTSANGPSCISASPSRRDAALPPPHVAPVTISASTMIACLGFVAHCMIIQARSLDAAATQG